VRRGLDLGAFEVEPAIAETGAMVTPAVTS